MKKVLTAIGSPILNQKLKRKEECCLLSNDITNDEELIEYLEREEEVDVLFVSSKIIEHYKVDEFIKIIRKIQTDMMIFFFHIGNLESHLREDENLRIFTSLDILWKEIENIFQEITKKDKQECISKIVAISGTNGVREKYVFHISC